MQHPQSTGQDRQSPYSTARLGDLSPTQIRDMRRKRQISEADVDRWTEIACAAVLQLTDGRRL